MAGKLVFHFNLSFSNVETVTWGNFFVCGAEQIEERCVIDVSLTFLLYASICFFNSLWPLELSNPHI